MAEATGEPATAIELPDGQIVTGKTSSLLGASAAALLNALKVMAGIPDELKLISPSVIEPIQHAEGAITWATATRACTPTRCSSRWPSAPPRTKTHPSPWISSPSCKDCDAHSTVILSQVDDGMFKKLGVNITCEPDYQDRNLYHK